MFLFHVCGKNLQEMEGSQCCQLQEVKAKSEAVDQVHKEQGDARSCGSEF